MKTVELSDAGVSTCWECGAQSGLGARFAGEGGPVLCAACIAAAHSVFVSIDTTDAAPKSQCGYPSDDEDDPVFAVSLALLAACAIIAVILLALGAKWAGVLS